MRAPGGKRIFLVAAAVGLCAVLGAAAADRWRHPAAATHGLTSGIAISEQLQPEAMRDLARRGYTKVIDLRPDGEASDQVPAATMARAAQTEGIEFVYVPVPHGPIPPEAVARLDAALKDRDGLTLLYCRSGRRAARTWSLVEAARPDGLAAPAILQAVRAAGQSADDLRGTIEERVRLRAPAPAQP